MSKDTPPSPPTARSSSNMGISGRIAKSFLQSQMTPLIALIAFLLGAALLRTLRARGFFGRRDEPALIDLLDLVALGTVADVARLTGFNRALVTQGLKVMARRGNTGLAALMDGAARHPDVQSFASLQTSADDPAVLDGAGDNMTSAGIPFRGGYGRKLPANLPEGEVFSSCGAAMLIDRALFTDLGGFDERFFCYCEDVDLGYRLRLTGRTTLLLPDARVAHVGSASTGVRSDFAIFHGSRNRVWTFIKNTPPLLLWLTTPLHVAVTGALLLLHLRRGDAGPAVRGIRAALAQPALGAVLTDRKAVQARRKVGSGSILRVMSIDPAAFIGRRFVIRKPKL